MILNMESLLVGGLYTLEYNQKEEIESEMSLIANERVTVAKVPGYSILETTTIRKMVVKGILITIFVASRKW